MDHLGIDGRVSPAPVPAPALAGPRFRDLRAGRLGAGGGGGGGNLDTPTFYGAFAYCAPQNLGGESTVANVWLISVDCVARQCCKSSCSELSTITLTFQYSRALAWIDDLTYERDPHSYDLCERHGQRMTVPTGWRLEDRRHRFRVVVPNRLAG